MGCGFNSSVWNAFVVLSPFGLGMFVYITIKAWRYQDWYHFFDPKHNSDPRLKEEDGDFKEHWSHYEGLAKLAITLSAGALAFLINAIANEKPPIGPFEQRLTDVAPIVVGFFGASILFLIMFLLWMAYCYEDYSHKPEHNSYSAWKYALTVSLGLMGFFAFMCGFGWLGVNLFRRG
jgi:hypothetical protein